jgi:hypothetical protein
VTAPQASTVTQGQAALQYEIDRIREAKHTPGPTIYADPKAPHQELTAAQRAILEAIPLVRPVGPWVLSLQPGGLLIADRLNATSPGGMDRLPRAGAFRTEAEVRAAIAKATGKQEAA